MDEIKKLFHYLGERTPDGLEIPWFWRDGRDRVLLLNFTEGTIQILSWVEPLRYAVPWCKRDHREDPRVENLTPEQQALVEERLALDLRGRAREKALLLAKIEREQGDIARAFAAAGLANIKDPPPRGYTGP